MASKRIANHYDGSRIAKAVEDISTNFTGTTYTQETPTSDMTKEIYSQSDSNRLAGALTTLASNLKPLKITDENEVSYPHRDTIKFINATIEDDSDNETTLITVEGGGSSIIQIPEVDTTKTYTYNRAEQELVFSSLDTENTIVTNNKKTDAGTYTCTVSLKSSTAVWNDLTNEDKKFTWTINPKSVSIPSVSGSYTYNGNSRSATISTFDVNEITKSGTDSATNAGTYTVYFDLTSTTNYKWTGNTTSQKSGTWTINRATGSITVSKTSIALDATKASDTFTFSKTGDGTVTVTSSDTSIAKVSGNTSPVTVSSPDSSTSGTATITVTLATGTNYTGDSKTVTVTADFMKIYGAEWDGTSKTTWTRTDDAAGFTDPVAAIGTRSGSSPFDEIYPWKGMKRVTDATVGELVEIPKFWYKWTRDGVKMKLQIVAGTFPKPDGFFCSPLHVDRGDGKGERSVAYVGRYHSGSDYKSKTGVSPKVNITRATARSGISALASDVWQYDYAALCTIQMLYLVEFADWNSQKTIGYGCGNNSAVQAVGNTDGMKYHTGTSQSSRTTYGCACQYRYIEGLWDNCYDWCDGIYFSGSNIYCILNPANFSDNSNGTLLKANGTALARATSSNYISAWTSNPTESGYEYAIYPSAVSGSESTYVTDYCSYGSSGVVLLVGGCYSQGQNRGLFRLDGNNAASLSDASVGCRIIKLP